MSNIKIKYKIGKIQLTDKLREQWNINKDVKEWIFLWRDTIDGGYILDSKIIACFDSEFEAENYRHYFLDDMKDYMDWK